MRRSRNNDRGGGRSRQNMSGGLGPGPLLTEHLKDIDLELELLKRKREMIEQQHSMFQPFQKPSQKNYNQQSYEYNDNEGHSGFNRDFSHLYDDGPQHNRKSLVRKRLSDNDWQHDSFPKRSAGHGQRGHGYSGPSPIRNQRPFTSGNEPKSGLPSKRGQGKSNVRAHIPEKKIVQKTIVKPAKAYAPPNKIASQPVPERVNLVAATLKSVAELEVRNREMNRLLPDQEPTKQMKGRMEMSLGAILSEVREVYANSPHVVTLNTVPLQRIIKQNIRDRIRTAMLGKIVGSTKEIIKEYRDMFPKESDRDIVNEALKTVGLGPEDQPLNAIADARDQYLEKPDNFFRENMFRLVNSHLYEMFSKIEEIYSKSIDNESNNKQMDFTQDSFEVDAAFFDTEMNTSNNKKENTAKKEEEDNSMKEGDKMEKDTAMTNEDNTAKIKEVTVKNEKDIIKEKDMVKDMTKKEKVAAVIAEGEEAAAKLGTLRASQYKFMLPRLIKRYIPTILKLLNMNKMYRQAISDLNKETRAKYVTFGKETLSEETAQQSGTMDDSSVLQSTPKKTPQYPLPYYVKVMGKPQLPKKKVMQPFLDFFHPKSIKKHRTIHNLLFIGFTDQNDFEAIVKANGTVIGRTTLSIRICDTSREKEEENVNAKQGKPVEEACSSEKLQDNLGSSADIINENSDKLKPEKLKHDDIIEPELDNQISKQLTAVSADISIGTQEENDVTTANSQKKDSDVDTGVANEICEDPNIIATDAPNQLVQDDEKNENTENNQIETTKNNPTKTTGNNPTETTENNPTETTENNPTETTENNPTENNPTETTENNPTETTENNPTETTENNPTETTENNPTETTENNPTETTENNPTETTENNPTETTENNPTETTENNPTETTKNNPTETTEHEKSECYKQQKEKTASNNSEIEIKEPSDKISTLSASASKATPTRASARLANVVVTPSSIKTRRASKLAQN